MTGTGNNRPKLVADNRYANRPVQAPKGPAAPTRKQPVFGGGGGGGGRGGGGGNTGGSAKPPSKPPSKPRRAPSSGGPRRPRGPLGFIAGFMGMLFRLVYGISWRIGLVTGLIIAAAVVYKATQLPDMTEYIDGRARGSVTLLDVNGQEFAWRGDQFGGMVTASTVSPYLRDAVIATEDRRFYRHFGISPRGIASAVAINLREGRGPLEGNGGSTITQQTAKLLCLGVPYDQTVWKDETEYEADCRRTTVWRKVKEAIFAMAMEVRYSKDDILTIYLNRAYMGAGSRGFEAASQRYFGMPSSDVNPAQAALLAGLLKAPSTYAPTANLQRSWDRANVVIGLMGEQGYITPEQAAEARTNPAQLSQAAQARAGGYYADWLMDTGPSYFTENTTEDVVITTTFDPRLQTAAEQALAWVFEEKVKEGSEAQAAIVVMSADGAVRAMVGGRQTTTGGAFNRAVQALRQTGSLFKPFVYAAALELGHSPNEIINDEPLCINVVGSGQWCPQNYDKEFKGPITLTQALRESRNIPAVLLSEAVGRDAVKSVANGFGISTQLADGPALALGASESTLIEMTGAYAGILNGGSAVMPYGLIDLRLKGDSEPLAGQGGGIGERVIREESARQLTWMMHQVIENGTGQRARIDGWQIAGKTGTTNAARDAWFIGFTGDYVTGVWMGYDNNKPLTGVTGGSLPAEIWHEVMVRILESMTPSPLPMMEPNGDVAGPVMTDSQAQDLIDQILQGLQDQPMQDQGLY